MKKFYFIIVLIIFFPIFAHAEAETITDYYRYCLDNTQSSSCEKWYLGSQKYYINEETQQVMGQGTYGPVPFESCTVASKDNWTCDNGTIYDTDGKITDNFGNEHFGFLTYWYYRTSDYVGPSFFPSIIGGFFIILLVSIIRGIKEII